MPLLAIGINHRTAPVDIRERVVFPPESLQEALRDLAQVQGISEAAILSTCNRTELYCDLPSDERHVLVEWLRRYHKLTQQDIEPYLYVYPDESAVKHVFRVASGLDSMVLGEPQILGQMKDAYRGASEAGTAGPLLGRLFQHTFSVAKQVRTDTAIGASPVSVAFAAVSLAKQIFGDLSAQTALLIGAGETVELTVRHLHENGIGKLIVANRTVERAHTVAAPFNGYAIALSELPAHLAEADIVISSTASPVPIVGKGAVEKALKVRKHRPMFMVDIAVPRDIEPEAGELADVYLYTVDDLREIIHENLNSRQEAAKQAEEIIEVQADRFMGWLRSLNAVATIRSVRREAEAARDETLAQARRKLAAGMGTDEALSYLARLLTNKLIHAPSSRLNQAGYDGRSDLIEAAQELFNLKDDDL